MAPKNSLESSIGTESRLEGTMVASWLERTYCGSWLVSLIGTLLYLGTTVALINPRDFEGALAARSEVTRSADNDPSWQFRNPEFDQWIAEIKREKEAVQVREQQLRELEARLETERQELATVTQSVQQLQADFDRNVVRFTAQEAENLKRQAKVIAGMSPEGAAALLKEMQDDDIVLILFTMKADEASLVLDTLSKLGKTEAKRAAAITERMRRALPAASPTRPAPST